VHLAPPVRPQCNIRFIISGCRIRMWRERKGGNILCALYAVVLRQTRLLKIEWLCLECSTVLGDRNVRTLASGSLVCNESNAWPNSDGNLLWDRGRSAVSDRDLLCGPENHQLLCSGGSNVETSETYSGTRSPVDVTSRVVRPRAS
jgi:hypothetical protein